MSDLAADFKTNLMLLHKRNAHSCKRSTSNGGMPLDMNASTMNHSMNVDETSNIQNSNQPSAFDEESLTDRISRLASESNWKATDDIISDYETESSSNKDPTSVNPTLIDTHNYHSKRVEELFSPTVPFMSTMNSNAPGSHVSISAHSSIPESIPVSDMHVGAEGEVDLELNVIQNDSDLSSNLVNQCTPEKDEMFDGEEGSDHGDLEEIHTILSQAETGEAGQPQAQAMFMDKKLYRDVNKENINPLYDSHDTYEIEEVPENNNVESGVSGLGVGVSGDYEQIYTEDSFADGESFVKNEDVAMVLNFSQMDVGERDHPSHKGAPTSIPIPASKFPKQQHIIGCSDDEFYIHANDSNISNKRHKLNLIDENEVCGGLPSENEVCTSPYRPKQSNEVPVSNTSYVSLATPSHRHPSMIKGANNGTNGSIAYNTSVITPSRIVIPSEKHHSVPLSPTTSKKESEFGRKLLVDSIENDSDFEEEKEGSEMDGQNDVHFDANGLGEESVFNVAPVEIAEDSWLREHSTVAREGDVVMDRGYETRAGEPLWKLYGQGRSRLSMESGVSGVSAASIESSADELNKCISVTKQQYSGLENAVSSNPMNGYKSLAASDAATVVVHGKCGLSVLEASASESESDEMDTEPKSKRTLTSAAIWSDSKSRVEVGSGIPSGLLRTESDANVSDCNVEEEEELSILYNVTPIQASDSHQQDALRSKPDPEILVQPVGVAVNAEEKAVPTAALRPTLNPNVGIPTGTDTKGANEKSSTSVTAHKNNISVNETPNTISSNSSAMLHLGDEWKEATTTTGGSIRTYYYNRRTRKSSWVLPKDAVYVQYDDHTTRIFVPKSSVNSSSQQNIGSNNTSHIAVAAPAVYETPQRVAKQHPIRTPSTTATPGHELQDMHNISAIPVGGESVSVLFPQSNEHNDSVLIMNNEHGLPPHPASSSRKQKQSSNQSRSSGTMLNMAHTSTIVSNMINSTRQVLFESHGSMDKDRSRDGDNNYRSPQVPGGDHSHGGGQTYPGTSWSVLEEDREISTVYEGGNNKGVERMRRDRSGSGYPEEKIEHRTPVKGNQNPDASGSVSESVFRPKSSLSALTTKKVQKKQEIMMSAASLMTQNAKKTDLRNDSSPDHTPDADLSNIVADSTASTVAAGHIGHLGRLSQLEFESVDGEGEGTDCLTSIDEHTQRMVGCCNPNTNDSQYEGGISASELLRDEVGSDSEYDESFERESGNGGALSDESTMMELSNSHAVLASALQQQRGLGLYSGGKNTNKIPTATTNTSTPAATQHSGHTIHSAPTVTQHATATTKKPDEPDTVNQFQSKRRVVASVDSGSEDEDEGDLHTQRLYYAAHQAFAKDNVINGVDTLRQIKRNEKIGLSNQMEAVATPLLESDTHTLRVQRVDICVDDGDGLVGKEAPLESKEFPLNSMSRTRITESKPITDGVVQGSQPQFESECPPTILQGEITHHVVHHDTSNANTNAAEGKYILEGTGVFNGFHTLKSNHPPSTNNNPTPMPNRQLFNEESPALSRHLIYCPCCGVQIASDALPQHIHKECEVSYHNTASMAETILQSIELGFKRAGILHYKYDWKDRERELKKMESTGSSNVNNSILGSGSKACRTPVVTPVKSKGSSSNNTSTHYVDAVNSAMGVKSNASAIPLHMENSTPMSAKKELSHIKAKAKREMSKLKETANAASESNSHDICETSTKSVEASSPDQGVDAPGLSVMHGSTLSNIAQSVKCTRDLDVRPVDHVHLSQTMPSRLSKADNMIHETTNTNTNTNKQKNTVQTPIAGMDKQPRSTPQTTAAKTNATACSCPFCGKGVSKASKLSLHFLTCTVKKNKLLKVTSGVSTDGHSNISKEIQKRDSHSVGSRMGTGPVEPSSATIKSKSKPKIEDMIDQLLKDSNPDANSGLGNCVDNPNIHAVDRILQSAQPINNNTGNTPHSNAKRRMAHGNTIPQSGASATKSTVKVWR